MFDKDLLEQLKGYLEKITFPIIIASSIDASDKSAQMKEMLDEIAACSEKVTHKQVDDDKRRPSFTIQREDSEIAVRFAGLPLGHEFSSLVLAMLQVGGVAVKEDENVIKAVTDLEGDYEFTTYMSLTCQNCPTVVQAINAMAVLNPRIKHTAVEGSIFQDEVQEKRILAVPTVYINGKEFASGRMTVADFVAKLDKNATKRNSEAINAKEPYEVIVIGAGPAGCAAAVYTARKGIRTGLVGERLGGQVNDTMDIENIISIPKTQGPKLSAALENHVREYQVDIISSVQAQKIIPGENGKLHTVEFAGGGELKAKSIILATGASWRTLNVPGENEYRNKGVTFCPHCDGPLFAGKSVAVVGGGNSGIEAAIDLAGVVGHVTVVEFLDQLKADEVLVKTIRSLPNVDVITSARSTEVVGDGNAVTALRYEDRNTGQIKELAVQGIFVQIGLLPNTNWLQNTVELNQRGEIVTDQRGQTSVPGIFAAGDCTDQAYKQIIISMGSGATAALSSFDYLIRHRD